MAIPKAVRDALKRLESGEVTDPAHRKELVDMVENILSSALDDAPSSQSDGPGLDQDDAPKANKEETQRRRQPSFMLHIDAISHASFTATDYDAAHLDDLFASASRSSHPIENPPPTLKTFRPDPPLPNAPLSAETVDHVTTAEYRHRDRATKHVLQPVVELIQLLAELQIDDAKVLPFFRRILRYEQADAVDAVRISIWRQSHDPEFFFPITGNRYGVSGEECWFSENDGQAQVRDALVLDESTIKRHGPGLYEADVLGHVTYGEKNMTRWTPDLIVRRALAALEYQRNR